MLTAVVTVIIFLVMVSLHEFGHFIVSKLVGVKVLEFAIGMGPAILKWKGRETQYALRIFPVGGYCRLEGEDEKTDDERAFCNQKWWKRFLVIVAGAVLNILLGFIILFGLNAGSEYIVEPVADEVISAGYADDAGITEGDKIIKINGKKIYFYPDLADALGDIQSQDTISVTVKRDRKKLNFSLIPSKETTETFYEEDGARVVTALNDGEKTEALYPYTDKMAASEYIGTSTKSERYIVGFTPKRAETGFWNNARYSFYYTGYVVKLIYRGLIEIFTTKQGIENVSGPVGIVTAVNTMVNSGSEWVKNVLSLSALLTINLGVFNLLPIPALDGGRLFFMIIELIRRKPIPAEKEGMVHAIGLMILLAFAVIISFKDIWYIIR